jgi:hypothetical protein
MNYKAKKQQGDLCIGWGIKGRKDGSSLVFTHNHLEDVHHRTKAKGTVKTSLLLPKLAPGQYSLEMSVWIDGFHYMDGQEIGSFSIAETPAFGSGISVASFTSSLLVESKWEFKGQ